MDGGARMAPLRHLLQQFLVPGKSGVRATTPLPSAMRWEKLEL